MHTSRTLWLNYLDKYNKIGFTGRLHLWWPLLLCRTIANGFHPTTHKVSLQPSKAIILSKTRVSCYSHHWSQFAVHETNWSFRVSGCDPCLNPYLNYIHYTPPWDLPTRLMELRLSHTKFMFHTISTTFISNIQFSCKFSTIQPKIHVLTMLTYQFQFIWIKQPCLYTYYEI